MSSMTVSYKQAILWLEAVAECSASAQHKTLHEILRYVSAMKNAGAVEPVMIAIRNSYDETPLPCRVAFETIDAMNTELSKVFVIEQGWTMLLKTRNETSTDDIGEWQYVKLAGSMSPALRCADAANGEGIAGVLQSVRQSLFPAGMNVPSLFPLAIKAIESDDAGANYRAERLHLALDDGWVNFHLGCLAHKLHAAAEWTFELSAATLTGAMRTLLCIRSSTSWSRLLHVLDQEIEARCRIVHAPPTAAAIEHRQNVLRAWCPPEQSSKTAVLEIVGGLLLNGDWRMRGVLCHHCGPGCCVDATETRTKMRAYLRKLLQKFRPTGLCRGNWSSWSTPLCFIGLLSSIHMLLPDLLTKAFAEVPCRKSTLFSLREHTQEGSFLEILSWLGVGRWQMWPVLDLR